MSRESLVMLLGLLVLFVPSLGIPADWKTMVLIGAGVLLLLLGYSLRRSMYLRTLERAGGEKGNDAFLEHKGSAPRVVSEESTPTTEE